MLVLSRRLNERIVFPAIGASVEVVAMRPGVVRLGIVAPPDVAVLREELIDVAAPHRGGTVPPRASNSVKQFQEFVGKRLEVTGAGLEVLKRCLETGRLVDAQATLDELRRDLEMLRRRVEVSRERAAERRCRALLVEDDREQRERLAIFLRKAGLEVDTAGDGSDALDYLRSQGRPDVVLLDMGLPRCDGPTAVRAIRRNPAFAGLKIYAVSGHRPEEYDLAKGPAGVDRWFHKPVDPAALVQNLRAELKPSVPSAPK